MGRHRAGGRGAPRRTGGAPGHPRVAQRFNHGEAIIDLKTGQGIGAAWLQVGGYIDLDDLYSDGAHDAEIGVACCTCPACHPQGRKGHAIELRPGTAVVGCVDAVVCQNRRIRADPGGRRTANAGHPLRAVRNPRLPSEDLAMEAKIGQILHPCFRGGRSVCFRNWRRRGLGRMVRVGPV